MKNNYLLRQLLLLIFSFFLVAQAQATHLRGGYMTYTVSEQNPRSYQFDVVIFRDIHGVAVEDQLTVHTGIETMLTTPGAIEAIGDATEKITYRWNYTYPADGTYTVSWTGVNRNNGVVNMAQPSEQHSMVLLTSLNVSTSAPNRNGIKYLNPSTTEAYVGTPLKYNLQAFDVDGDSLAYSLVSPHRLSTTGQVVPVSGYYIPAGLAINQFGEINWPEPTIRGEFTFAVEVRAYREGRLVSTSINDMQILVREADETPEIELTNFNRLISSSAGYILARPDLPLKLSFFVRNPSSSNIDALVLHKF